MDMDYGGMTVNERLYASGLIDKFDKAIKENDIKTLKNIIEKIDLDESYIETLIEDFNLEKEDSDKNKKCNFSKF